MNKAEHDDDDTRPFEEFMKYSKIKKVTNDKG
jgi:hypothetical protein